MGATADDKARRWATAQWWLPLSHASAIESVDGAQLVAVCDVNEAAAQAARLRFNAAASYVDYREMFAREHLEAVAIATRTAERKAIIQAAVGAGVKGIFCEKPMCRTLEDADQLAALIRENGVHFVYGTRRRFMPIYERAKAKLDAGWIGETRTILTRFGLSPLLWTHPHTVDIASFFAGDGPVAYAQADLEFDPAAIHANVIDADPRIRQGYIRFANGVAAHIVASDSFDVEISGPDGILTVLSDGAAIEWRRRKEFGDGRQDLGFFLERGHEDNPGDVSGSYQSIKMLSEAIRGGPPQFHGADQAVRSLEVLFAFMQSHLREGQRVPWPIPRTGLEITGRSGALYS